MAKYFIGTSGWSYDFWKGSFYPYHTQNYLEYYANESPVVEVNSTFYEIPKKSLVKDWHSRTPPDFSFSVKTPMNISHQSGIWNFDSQLLTTFLKTMEELGEKLGFVLFQMPPTFIQTTANTQFLIRLIRATKTLTRARIAVELRSLSWFEESTYKLLEDCILVATPFLHASLSRQLSMHLDHLGPDIYIRLFSDARELGDDEVGKKSLDRRVEISTLVDILKAFDERTRMVYIFVSNQFSGNAPADARKIHQELERRGLNAEGFMPQLSLDDFF